MDADIGSLILEWMDMDELAGLLCTGWIDCRILVRRLDTLPLHVDAATLSLFPKYMFHSTVRLLRRENTRKDRSTPISPPQTTSLVSNFLWGGLFHVQMYYVIIWLNRNHILLNKYCIQNLNSSLLIDWWVCNSSQNKSGYVDVVQMHCEYIVLCSIASKAWIL